MRASEARPLAALRANVAARAALRAAHDPFGARYHDCPWQTRAVPVMAATLPRRSRCRYSKCEVSVPFFRFRLMCIERTSVCALDAGAELVRFFRLPRAS